METEEALPLLPPADPPDPAVVQQLEALETQRPGWGQSLVYLAASLALFAALGLFRNPAGDLALFSRNRHLEALFQLLAAGGLLPPARVVRGLRGK